MGKKNKKKGKGAEKTALKTEKNAERKAKKVLQEAGEDDIENLIAEFQNQDRKRLQIVEEKCPQPSPRCNMTLTPHPDKEELIMFGGEYFNGLKTFLYNDLFFYNIKNNEWTSVKVPNAPPPRCAHQAVVLRQGGGQLWIFGGEFASPTQSQFYHYKDLWVYHIKEKKWDQVKVPGGPTSRSGHRMAVCKKQIFIFGGFHDNIRDYKYYNDIHCFNLETYTWVKLDITGVGPSPRSACQVVVTPDQNGILIYGGYSKERVRKDVDKGNTHSDMFLFTPEGKNKDEFSLTKWKWTQVRQSGSRPGPRCGFTMVAVPGDRAVCFGGVMDEEDSEEDVSGLFYNEMYTVELDKGKWHELILRGKKDVKDRKRRRKKKDEGDGDGESEEEMEVDNTNSELENLSLNTQNSQTPNTDHTMEEESVFKVTVGPQSSQDDDIFKVTIGPQSGGAGQVQGAEGGIFTSQGDDIFMPCARMNALLAVKSGVLYLYGGMYEVGDRQVTLSDMYSLDLNKLEEWNTLIKNNIEDQEWIESDSSSDDDEEEMEGAEGGVSDEDDAMEEDAPTIQKGESVTDYFSRSKDYWLELADCEAEEAGQQITGKQLKKRAFTLAEEHFNQ